MLPPEITKNPKIKLRIKDIQPLEKGFKCRVFVHTKFRDPSLTREFYEAPSAEVRNSAERTNSANGKNIGEKQKAYYWHHIGGGIGPGNIITEYAPSIYSDNYGYIRPMETRTFTVGGKYKVLGNLAITNFALINKLPAGVGITSIEMSQKFKELPGAKYEIIPNYDGKGGTAVKFTADQVYDRESIREVAKIKVRLLPSFDFDNEDELVSSVDVSADKGTFHRVDIKGVDDQVIIPVLPIEELFVQKNIRLKGEQNWSENIQTPTNSEFEYKLQVINSTKEARIKPVVYDILPKDGDSMLYTGSRGSEFENRLSDEPIKLPEGWKVQYTCDTNITPQNRQNASWSDNRCGKVTALKFTADKIDRNAYPEFIVPMIARPTNTAAESKEYFGEKALNNFIFQYGNKEAIESSNVSNEIVPPRTIIKFKKCAKMPKDKNNSGAENTNKCTKPLEGAKFGLFDENGNLKKTAISNKKGDVEFIDNATPGWTVRELQAPPVKRGDHPVCNNKSPNCKEYPFEYALSKTARQLVDSDYKKEKLDDSKSTYNIELENVYNSLKVKMIKNETVLGNVKFTKVDINGKPFEGAEFTLTPKSTKDSDGKDGIIPNIPTMKAVSDSNGVVKFRKVPIGAYELTETKTPNKNLQPINPIRVVVKKEGYTAIVGKEGKVVNDKYIFDIYNIGVRNIKREPFGQWQTNDGSNISSGKFKLYRPDGKVEEIDIEKDNKIKDLEANKIYEIQQEKTYLGNYYPNTTKYKFQINGEGELCDENGAVLLIQDGIIIPNEEKEEKSSFKIIKTDKENDRKIAGVEFALFKKHGEGWDKLSSGTTDGNGELKFNSLPQGDYQAREIKPALGYAKTNETYEFSVDKYDNPEGGFTWSISNYPIKIKIHKFAPFVEGLEENEADRILSSNPDLKKWQNSAGSFTVGSVLAGAKFDLKDSQGKKINSVETDDKGNAIIKGLKLDSSKVYKLEEEKAPFGYIKKRTPIPFRVDDYALLENFDGSVNFDIPNTQDKGILVVNKLDETSSEPLEGATFKLTGPQTANPSGLQKEGVTNNNGMVSFSGLEYGKEYILKETHAPDGYKLDSTEHKIKIADDSNPIRTLKIYNTALLKKVQVIKTSEEGTALKGVKFELIDSKNTTVALPETNNEGKIDFKAKIGETYQLRETSTLPGYALLPQPIKFKVDSNGNTEILGGGVNTVYTHKNSIYSILTVVNYPEGKVPLSGRNGLYQYLLIGVIILTGVTFLTLSRKKNE